MNAKQTALDAYLARTVAIRAKLERLLAGASLNGEPCALRARSGERVPVEVSGVAEFRDGRVTGARVVLRDLRDKAA